MVASVLKFISAFISALEIVRKTFDKWPLVQLNDVGLWGLRFHVCV